MPLASWLLARQLNEAANGRYEALMSLSRMVGGEMSDSITMGMQLSVICTEDADSMVGRTEDAETVLGNRMVEAMAAMPGTSPPSPRPTGCRARSRRLPCGPPS